MTDITPAMLLESGDPSVRRRGRRAAADRVRNGWSPETAMSAPLRGYTRMPVETTRERKRPGPQRGSTEAGGLTLRDIARQWGMSQEGVRRIEMSALAKLRRALTRGPNAITADDVLAWLDGKARGADDVIASESASSYTLHAAREEREPAALLCDRERRALDERRIAREVDAWAEDWIETARAHRMIERVVSGMEGP